MVMDPVALASPAFDAIDDATTSLIIQLQCEDIENLRSSSTGKRREDEIQDSDFAMSVFQEDLQQMNATLSDRCMSRSLARAVITDSALLTDAVVTEDAIANDRAVAERVNNGDETSVCAIGSAIAPTLDDLFIARLNALYVSGTGGEGSPPAATEEDETISGESSEWAALREPSRRAIHHECISCGDRKRDFLMFQTPCGHHYCQQCLSTLFELSTTDETLFPPRCCRQNIPLASARLYLSAELIQQFQEKSVEFRTADRTYCSRPTCSSFITPAHITPETSTATCTECHASTCTICKGNTHDGDCPEDIATQLTLAAAREQGWQRCYNCRLIVELDLGCNHMTCRCGAQFCYVCGLRWKNCTCAQWTEERLVARAQQVVAREQPRIPAPAAEQVMQVQQAVEHLRQRHNCEHENWQWVMGPNQCEECRYNLPQYIFECRQCRIRACNRCKRNRL